MKRSVLRLLTGILVFSWLVTPIFATYEQAYQDYLFQFDSYRQRYSEFQVAKNEYEKFQTLTSQATALDKTKIMLAQRDQLLRAYLIVLYEKLNDPNSGLPAVTKGQYQTILTNEIVFLETHAQRIPAIGSLEDAVDVSRELESHYGVLQASIRQILVGFSLGQLAIIAKHYDDQLLKAKALVSANSALLPFAKQETVNRWLLQIANKRNFYQQKVDAIAIANAQMSTTDAEELDTVFNAAMRNIGEARQYLAEGASFFVEFKNALKYAN